MYPTETCNYNSFDTQKSLDEVSQQAHEKMLLAEAPESVSAEPDHQPNLLERITAAKNRFFERMVGIPEVKISKDHTAQIRSSMEYEVLFDKTPGTLCTLFYRDDSDKQLKEDVIELARSLNGKVTIAFVNEKDSKDFVHACGLTEKLPAFALADKHKTYIHLYINKTNATSFKELIERYDRGDKKLED